MSPRPAAAALELTAFFGLFFFDQWALHDIVGGPAVAWRVLVYAAAAAVVAGAMYRRGSVLPPIEGAPVGFGRAATVVGIATVLMAAALLIGAAATGHLETELDPRVLGRSHPAKWLNVRIALAAVQQLMLHLFVLPACLELSGGRVVAAVIGGSALFAAMHVPNPALVLLCFGAGLTWLPLYRRLGPASLGPLAAAHMLLALLVRGALPQHIHLNLMVGGQAVAMQAEYAVIRADGHWALFEELVSEETYRRLGGTDEDYIRGLYRRLLGRLPDDDELEEWLRLNRKRPRADIVRQFLTGEEFRGRSREAAGGR